MNDQANAGTIDLGAGDATASLALVGAEPMSWRVAGRDYLWCGDPAHWERRAPILFPVVGASANGRIKVDGRSYLMQRHGFARDAVFSLVERSDDRARLRLVADEKTRALYPFDFSLDVVATLTPRSLALAFEVRNAGAKAMPYAVGFHPAFPWPFADGEKTDYAIDFTQAEIARAPNITDEGLIAASDRPIPLTDRRLPLAPGLFAHDALCFLNARSEAMRFRAASGATIAMQVEDFPHFAVWTKPMAPFLSLECWTGYADPDGFDGELSQRPSMRQLTPGAAARHVVTLALESV